MPQDIESSQSIRWVIVFWTVSSSKRNQFHVTCPGEGRDGAKAQGSIEAPRQRGGRRLALTRTLLAVDELGEVGRWGKDEGVC